jgi:hypothetical protein
LLAEREAIARGGLRLAEDRARRPGNDYIGDIELFRISASVCESSEWVTNMARDAGIHYLAAGHYATERLGVRALGGHLARRFGLDVEFIDIPNPV